ncbi:MAG: hypothetical protein P4N41_04465 [Negativicutes bacterium]|nr:hypothetical protein [Negativicutes bacterium]
MMMNSPKCSTCKDTCIMAYNEACCGTTAKTAEEQPESGSSDQSKKPKTG